MPLIVFEPRAGESFAPLEVPCPDGGALVDVCDANPTNVPFSCKAANCGTCRVEILEGASELLPPKDDELDLLGIFAAAPNVRLACQAKTRPGLARLRVRPVDDGADF